MPCRPMPPLVQLREEVVEQGKGRGSLLYSLCVIELLDCYCCCYLSFMSVSCKMLDMFFLFVCWIGCCCCYFYILVWRGLASQASLSSTPVPKEIVTIRYTMQTHIYIYIYLYIYVNDNNDRAGLAVEHARADHLGEPEARANY